MSVDVRSYTDEETFFSNAGWAFMLEFAMAYGWQPRGTTAPRGQKDFDWDGNYDPAQGQTVTASDAKALV